MILEFLAYIFIFVFGRCAGGQTTPHQLEVSAKNR